MAHGTTLLLWYTANGLPGDCRVYQGLPRGTPRVVLPGCCSVRLRFTSCADTFEIINVSAGKHIQNCIKLVAITAAPPAAANQIKVAVV